MDDVILHPLRSGDDVPHQARVIGNLHADRIFGAAHGREGMHGGADAADALREEPRVPRIAPDENLFQTPHHRAR